MPQWAHRKWRSSPEHHQAVQTIAPAWRPVAWSADGLVEAMEHQQHPWMMGVQWHPELSIDDPVQHHLFQAFITAAQLRLQPCNTQ